MNAPAGGVMKQRLAVGGARWTCAICGRCIAGTVVLRTIKRRPFAGGKR